MNKWFIHDRGCCPDNCVEPSLASSIALAILTAFSYNRSSSLSNGL